MELFEEVDENEAKCKKEKPGIVYLSRIPRRMNVKQIRHVFGSFGKVGRVFLKPIGEFGMKKGRMCNDVMMWPLGLISGTSCTGLSDLSGVCLLYTSPSPRDS